MGLSSLDAALSGLRTSQQQISVISNNVANVSTPGYSRKILPQSAQSLEGVTVGVRSGIVTRNVDLNLERDLWTQISAVGKLDVKQGYLNRVEQFHGAPDAELSFAAEISRLRDSFSSLAATPEDSFLQSQTVVGAEKMANKINELADLILTSRNDAQNELRLTIDRANQLLEQIADLNDQVQDNLNINRSTALAEDQRDEAIKELTDMIDVSFFVRGDGVMVVQTDQGVQLADNRASRIEFDPTPLGPGSAYPESAAAIYVVDKDFKGDPATDRRAINITEASLGGRIGGLLELRDEDFPRQMAQMDELAHKLALRFEQQGLRLFTDGTGNIPNDDAPDTSTDPRTPVNYVGFSTEIRVNQAVLADNSLVQQGTYGALNIQDGSNEVIRRVLDFTFGAINYQQAYNDDTNTQVDLLNTGADDLQTWLGLVPENNLQSNVDLTQYADVASIVAAGGDDVFGTVAPPAETDRFTITFDDPDLGIGPQTVTVDLRDPAFTGAFAIGSVDPVDGGTIDNAAEQLRASIDAQIAAFPPAAARYNASVSLSNNGQLTFSAASDIQVAAAGAEGISTEGFGFLGLGAATSEAQDPYFDIQVGNADPVRITIEPNESAATLLTKIQNVPNVAAQIVGGVLEIRPGDDDGFLNQSFGGDIKILGGPSNTSAATYGAPPATSTRTSIDDGVNITSALFGTYSINGGVISNTSPVTDMHYGSETNASATPPIPTVAFREDFLGPGANISIEVIGSSRLVDFAQKIVNQHTSQLISMENQLEDEQSLQNILQTQLLDESGVNLDEELSNLIVYQTAFSASARVVNAVDELFQELLNAV